jgi:glycosyltransferase involved in cell wall biosynthesis
MGGAEYSLLELLSGLEKYPVELHAAISQREALYGPVSRLPVSCHEIFLPYLRKEETFIARLNRFKVACSVAFRIYRLSRKEQIRTIYCNTYRTLPFCLFVKWFGRIRIVCHCRDSIRSVWLGRFIRYMADDVIAVSEYVCRQLPRADTFRMHVVPNGVDLRRFTPADTSKWLRRKYHLPDDVMLIGNIGRILPWKNQRDYLLVAEQLLRHNRKLHFFIVGAVMDESCAYRLKQQIHTWGLTSHFTFTGQVDDIVPYISGFTVLLHTAREEPFGRVLIEAAASAVPVIAYASGGPSEIIENGRTGYLVSDGQIEHMAELTSSLLNRPELHQSMGRSARERAAGLFDSQAYVRKIYQLLTYDPRSV